MKHVPFSTVQTTARAAHERISLHNVKPTRLLANKEDIPPPMRH